jgi:hypothetical protein
MVYGRTIQILRGECLMAANGLRPGFCPGEFRVVVFQWAQKSWTVLSRRLSRAVSLIWCVEIDGWFIDYIYV